MDRRSKIATNWPLEAKVCEKSPVFCRAEWARWWWCRDWDTLAEAFVGEEEEGSVLDDRPADGPAELIVAELRVCARPERLEKKSLAVELVVTEIFKRGCPVKRLVPLFETTLMTPPPELAYSALKLLVWMRNSLDLLHLRAILRTVKGQIRIVPAVAA